MDNIAIALTQDASYRVYGAVTTNLVAKAQKLHSSYPVATAALGRTLTAAAMMGGMLKDEQGSITIQIKGDGPIGSVVAVSDANSTVRGYCANPDIQLPLRRDGKLDVGGGVGKNGFVNVVRSSGTGQPYSGNVPLVSGEIAEDLTSYFAISEQTPTAVGLGVLVGVDGAPLAAGGFLLQLMPGSGYEDEGNTAIIEQNLKSMPAVTDIISKGGGSEQIIAHLLKGIEYNILGKRDTFYQCNCSRERVERALELIGKSDLQSLIDEQKETEVNCSFCDKKYAFSIDNLGEILKRCKK